MPYTHSLLSFHHPVRLVVLGISVPWRVIFPSDEADFNHCKIQLWTEPWPSAPSPPSCLHTIVREFLEELLGTLQAPLSDGLFPTIDLPDQSISGLSVLWLEEFNSTWGGDRRLQVIKSLLNYLMQDQLVLFAYLALFLGFQAAEKITFF